MHRFLLASSMLLAACSAPARAPAANHAETTRYSLIPLDLGGGEGRHSMSHSSTHVTGSLDVTRSVATLSLASDTFVGHVRCPVAIERSSRQACAPAGVQDTRSAASVVLRGSARTERGALIVDVSDRDRAIALTCRETYLGLACTIDRTTLWGGPGDRPSTLAFVSPGRKVLATAPTRLEDIGSVVGALSIENDRAQLVLGIEGEKMNLLPATVVHHDHGMVVRAQTAPTRNVQAVCKTDGNRLVCEMSGDRSVLGRAEHIHGEMVFAPPTERTPMPAHAPLPAHAPRHASR